MARNYKHIYNLAKSEAVLLGSWRQQKPDVGVRTVMASKYLGVITGEDKTLSAKAISDRIAKVHAQLDMWDSRLSSSPVDRAMVAKTMCLYIIWYHAGLMPGWEKTLDELDKRVLFSGPCKPHLPTKKPISLRHVLINPEHKSPFSHSRGDGRREIQKVQFGL